MRNRGWKVGLGCEDKRSFYVGVAPFLLPEVSLQVALLDHEHPEQAEAGAQYRLASSTGTAGRPGPTMSGRSGAGRGC